MVAERLRSWLGKLDVGTLYIAPGSPWENAFAESFNSRFRDEFLALEVFDGLAAARKLTKLWRDHPSNPFLASSFTASISSPDWLWWVMTGSFLKN